MNNAVAVFIKTLCAIVLTYICMCKVEWIHSLNDNYVYGITVLLTHVRNYVKFIVVKTLWI